MTTNDEAKYCKDEKVLCKHGLCFYPAKILEVDRITEPIDDGYRYFVHYQGWNPKWDEWVADDRLDKFTEEKAKAAVEEQKKLTEQMKKRKGSCHGNKASKTQNESDRVSVTSSVPDHVTLKDIESGSRGSSPSVESTVSSSATVATSSGAGAPTGSTSARKSRGKTSKSTAGSINEATLPGGQPPDSKKRKIRTSEGQIHQSISNQTQVGSANGANAPASSSCVQSEQDYQTRPEVCIKIPEDLRPLLIDDWDLVVQQMKLVRLPAKLTVAQIFKDYVGEKQSLRNISASKLSQVIASAEGLCAYFDIMLPVQLLYKFEKPQYAELYEKNPDFLPSEYYGYIHLLRLFVRLGHMLACTALDDKSMSLVLSGVAEFLKYMKKIKPQHLAPAYDTATPDYQRLAYS